MMDIEKLIQEVKLYNPACDGALLRRARDFAAKSLEPQQGRDSESSFRRSMDAAAILAEFRMDLPTITAALLSGAADGGGKSAEDLEKEFSEEIACLVDGVSKLNRITWESLEEEKAEALRRMLLAMAGDTRVVLIKLAGHLLDMRKIRSFGEETQDKVIRDTMKIFSPLAGRLGVWAIKRELDDLAFAYTDPGQFEEIERFLADSREARERRIGTFVRALRLKLLENGIEAEVSGRSKHAWSIFQKTKNRGIPLEEIHDILGVRVIVPAVEDCYSALDIIHRQWVPVLDAFDDYIARPKASFYRSIHTTVKDPSGRPIEIQIRTVEMDLSAEFGAAAHWRYKDGGRRDIDFEEKLAGLRSLLDWQRDLLSEREIPGTLKARSAVIEDRVYVFTPRGDIIDLPKGSTPLDFAYRIHSALGHRCRGAKVNGRLMPLDYQLQTGDRLEIMTTKKGGPSRDWLNPQLRFIYTRQARQKLEQWFRAQEKEENIGRGRELLDREMKRAGIKEKSHQEIARLFLFRRPRELFEAVGRGAIKIQTIVDKLSEPVRKKLEEKELPAGPPRRADASCILVRGMDGILTRQARCCSPLPGESITGFITRGRGVTVHRSSCRNISQQAEKGRLIDVEWREGAEPSWGTMRVSGRNQKILLRDMGAVFDDEKASVVSLNVMPEKKGSFVMVMVTLEVASVNQLNRILNKIRRLPTVLDARR